VTGFEVGSSITVRASHVMPDAPPPEDRLHEHDYRIDVVIERAELDEGGMVCDLDVVNAALRGVAGRLDGIDLDLIRPEDRPAVTVEVLAAWIHAALAPEVRSAGGEVLSVRVWESNEEFGGYRASVR
jgi:6-pyruvoyl-tetrahydropterin synthase